MTDKLKINSFNARGLREKIKRNTIFKYMKQHHNGIIYLQETHSDVTIERKWKSEWSGRIYYSHGTTQKNGVAICVPSHIQCNLNDIKNDVNGRFLLLDINIDENNFILLNVYAPTKDHPKDQIDLFKRISDLLEEYTDRNIVMGGDFNTCINPTLDKHGAKLEKRSEYSQIIEDYLEQQNMCDIWTVIKESKFKDIYQTTQCRIRNSAFANRLFLHDSKFKLFN